MKSLSLSAFLLVILNLFIFSTAIAAEPGIVSVSYHFNNPLVLKYQTPSYFPKDGKDYYTIELSEAPSLANPGYPALPMKAAKILIPQGTELAFIEISTSPALEIPGNYHILQGQKEAPISSETPPSFTPPKPEIYQSSKIYPSELYQFTSTQSFRGYHFVMLTLNPVHYIPYSGKLFYYPNLTVKVHYQKLDEKEKSKSYTICRALKVDQERIASIVDNPDLISSYQRETALFESKLDSMKATYHYVIITNNALAGLSGTNTFQGLVQHKQNHGIPSTIYTVENIYTNYTGVDNPEKIRKFIIDAYTNWDTQYVLLGGDADGGSGNNIVPCRGLYALATGEEMNGSKDAEDTNIPADFYFEYLDGNYNYDNDTLWGEPTDGVGGGEVDLFGEVSVGRATVDNSTEMNRFVSKVLTYENLNPNNAYLKNALMCGEYLWPDTYGDYYKQEVAEGSSNWGYTTVGFPEDWNISTLYESEQSWDGSDIIALMNSNTINVINHLGHANVTYVLKIYNSNIDALTNSNYFILYTQGCYCGSFDNRNTTGGYGSDDCAMEHFSMNTTGAIACLGNSRYGWGVQGSTDGSSQLYDREFWDAVFGEKLYSLGDANNDSKGDGSPFINIGARRWACYEVNLFGDPQMRVGGIITSNGFIYLDHEYYKDDATITITVVDADLNTNNASIEYANITATSASADSETVTLTETYGGSAIFVGTIQLDNNSSHNSGNGILEAIHNDLLTFTYNDAGSPKQCTAHADYVPPIISNVAATYITDHSATIVWNTDELSDSLVNYNQASKWDGSAYDGEMTTTHSVTLTGLEAETHYYYEVRSTDQAGNEGFNDNGGSLFEFTTLPTMCTINEPLDTNPGWSVTGQWAFGQPTGNAGDPSFGHTGMNVYGYNLSGAYADNMGAEYLTTLLINCSDLLGTTLSFWRWLGVEGYSADQALIQVSNGDGSWYEVWKNDAAVQDSQWVQVSYDISQYADQHPFVQIRWVMGPTDSNTTYCGWNIDDISICGGFIPVELFEFSAQPN